MDAMFGSGMSKDCDACIPHAKAGFPNGEASAISLAPQELLIHAIFLRIKTNSEIETVPGAEGFERSLF